MNKFNLFTSLSLLLHLLLLISLISPVPVSAECTCDKDEESAGRDRSTALRLKIGALVSILVFGAIGVSLPVLAKVIPAFRPENDFFYIIKSFAAGVILATGFIHVLPDAFENLTSPRLKDHPWGDFSFTGFVAMMTAIGTLMVDTFATGYYRRLHFNKAQPVIGDEEQRGEHAGHVHVHTHATHGHAHGSSLVSDDLGSTDLIRHRVISQVLELGIIVHSVIIGIALGASSNPSEVKTLLVALSFHQFFEGMGLGGCISQAKFKSRAVLIMALFFALTTPVGVAIGIGITTVYDEDSPTALIVEGIFNAASAGILIYMALVDLLAADFMSSRLLNSGKLQLGAYLSLLVGAGCMSLLAKWA